MFTSADNKGKLFSLLSSDKYAKERLLLPTSTSDPLIIEKQNPDTRSNEPEEKLIKVNTFPPATGYIKYPVYDFF